MRLMTMRQLLRLMRTRQLARLMRRPSRLRPSQQLTLRAVVVDGLVARC
jgi:hypothetical protein